VQKLWLSELTVDKKLMRMYINLLNLCGGALNHYTIV